MGILGQIKKERKNKGKNGRERGGEGGRDFSLTKANEPRSFYWHAQHTALSSGHLRAGKCLTVRSLHVGYCCSSFPWPKARGRGWRPASRVPWLLPARQSAFPRLCPPPSFSERAPFTFWATGQRDRPRSREQKAFVTAVSRGNLPEATSWHCGL